MNLDIITAIGNIALAFSVLVGLIFGVAQVRTAKRERKDRLTLETLRNFQSREFSELIRFVVSDRIPLSYDRMSDMTDAERTMFIQFSQMMEHLGILVAEGLVDIDLVDKVLSSFVIVAWKKYKPLFASMRGADPYNGEYFQWLAERMHERLKNQPRQPAYQQPT